MRVTVATTVAERDATELWPVYDAIFADQPDRETWRASVWDRHAARDGFRLVRAYAEERLVGFGYGYTGERGQWWTDHVAEVLPSDVGREWLGGHFELVSIGVLPAWRGRGVATALLRRLTDDLPHERRLLMTTADPADPARRLYAREGWRVIGPGLGEGSVVMGRARPASGGRTTEPGASTVADAPLGRQNGG